MTQQHGEHDVTKSQLGRLGVAGASNGKLHHRSRASLDSIATPKGVQPEKMDVEPLYCAEQIRVPEELPGILKEWTKEVIRQNPRDINKFSARYASDVFSCMLLLVLTVHVSYARQVVREAGKRGGQQEMSWVFHHPVFVVLSPHDWNQQHQKPALFSNLIHSFMPMSRVNHSTIHTRVLAPRSCSSRQ